MGRHILAGIGIAVLALSLAGCNGLSGGRKPAARTVALLELPPLARAKVEELLIGGQVNRIEMKRKNDETIYNVKGTLNGKDVAYDITANGKVLTRAESIPYETLPAAVRQACTLYFGSAEQFTAAKETEGDKTFYAVKGSKEGAPVTLKLTEAGKIVAEEKE